MAIIRPARVFEGSDLGLDAVVEIGGIDVGETLDEIIGPVLWLGQNEGFCKCPGAHLHTTGDGKRDCKLYLAPVPTVSCFHASCAEMVQATNKRLRRALAGALKLIRPARSNTEQKAEIAAVRCREALRKRAAMSRNQILRGFAWPEKERISPYAIPEDSADHWCEIMSLFDPNDIVWAGTIYDSGLPCHEHSFRRAADWLKEEFAPGQFTCPSSFKEGSYSRGNSQVEKRRFIVVESDELDRDSIAAVFRGFP